VDPTYPMFAAAHPLFYDRPATDPSEPFQVSSAPTWQEWSSTADTHWVHWSPGGAPLPEQGWKIHVSATQETAEPILRATSEYCHATQLTFKHVRTRARLSVVLSKDAERSSGGKFITIYPRSSHELYEALTALDAEIGGEAGPYILSDLRWREGPLHVRYGAFHLMQVTLDGLDVPAIRNVTTGELVPDVRDARFFVPSWVTVPEFLQREADGLEMAAPDGFPQVARALHYSNAGGVYSATSNGRPIVLKEARPFAGWTPDGRDAVERLHHEAKILSGLAGGPVPRVLGSHDFHGHAFLALEELPGTPLPVIIATEHPLTIARVDERELERYRAWAGAVAASLRSAVADLHRSGVAHGDLHPGNVIIDGTTARLVDLEIAVPLHTRSPAVIGAPGFLPTDSHDPKARDLFALACIELHLYYPLVPLLHLHHAMSARLVRAARQDFGLAATWGRDLLPVLTDRRGQQVDDDDVPSELDELIAQTVRGLLSDCEARTDRMWPGDPQQFNESMVGLSYGALGVAAVLSDAGAGLAPAQTRWLSSRIDAVEPLGLMAGGAGAALAARRLGFHAAADHLFDRLRNADLDERDFSLYSGVAGIGLTLLQDTADDSTVDVLVDTMKRNADRWNGAAPDRVHTNRGGLLRGASGPALLALRLYEITDDPHMLRIAKACLDFDTATLVEGRDGSLHVNEGWRAQPYLAFGSAGIGVALLAFLRHEPGHDRYREVLTRIVRAASSRFTVQSGLFHGRAGLIQFLVLVGDRLGTGDEVRAAIGNHVQGLRLTALPSSDGLRFPGDQLLRASCDLGTGSAGVLSSLLAVRATEKKHKDASLDLPLFLPTALSFKGR